MASTTQLSCSSSYGSHDVQILTDTVCMYVYSRTTRMTLFVYLSISLSTLYIVNQCNKCEIKSILSYLNKYACQDHAQNAKLKSHPDNIQTTFATITLIDDKGLFCFLLKMKGWRILRRPPAQKVMCEYRDFFSFSLFHWRNY